MSLKNITLLVVLSAGLSACGHYSEDLASMDINESPALQDIAPAAGTFAESDAPRRPYTYYLAKEYMDLARTENESYDYKSAAYFTKKAKMAHEGMTVMPSNYKEFDIGDDYAATAMEARERLNIALQTQNAPENYPALAKAQAQYDSFLEQLEEGHQKGDIKNCKDSFYQAISALQRPAENELNFGMAFAMGQATMDSNSMQIIAEAVSFYRENPNFEFTIVGYNAAGEMAPDYQGQSMAAKRAANIKAALVRAGIPSDSVRAYTANQQAMMNAAFAPEDPQANIIMRLKDQSAVEQPTI